jgi:hypothetical protein
MNFRILKAFIEDQRKAKRIVFEHLGVPQDIAAMDWVVRHRSIYEAYQKAPFAEVFRPHGYGLELKIGALHIDFDYSREGRADGFDAWRIFAYMKKGKFDNHRPEEPEYGQVSAWLEKLCAIGGVSHPDNLYYLAGDLPRED